MGRNRTPTSILDGRGAFITHKDRQRPSEPTSDAPIGSAPSYSTKDERKMWNRLVKEALPGVLKQSDRLMFAVLVRLATEFESRQPMKAADRAQLVTLSSKFAMNPADRSRVTVEQPKKSSLTEFISRRQEA